MTDEPLERLQPRASLQIWVEFDAAFDFRPSVYEFPAIIEPAESITWSLDTPGHRPDERNVDHVVTLICAGLTACTPPGSSLLILEWQHTSYRLRPDLPPTDMFLPEALTRNLPPGWPRSPYPHGDYPLMISEDFRYGSFGHPWEHTLCLFGTELLDAVADEITHTLPILRHRGQPTTPN